MSKCPFCGSEKTHLKTPYVEIGEKGEYEQTETYCCGAQKRNAEYVRKRYDPSRGDLPDPNEVSKW